MRPDFYAFREFNRVLPTNAATIKDAYDVMKAQGATWVRMTVVNERHQPKQEGEEPFGFWIEGWKVRPEKEGPFDPPLTMATGEPS